MFSTAVRVLYIKDLKDLSVFFRPGFYRHAGPKGPEEMFHVNARGGQAPALRARKGFSSPCAVRDQALPNYSFLRLSC